MDVARELVGVPEGGESAANLSQCKEGYYGLAKPASDILRHKMLWKIP